MTIQKSIVFNIGLNNNPLQPYQIIELLESNGFYVERNALCNGRYKDETEPTLLVDTIHELNIVSLLKLIETLCNVMKQECIAVKIDGVGGVIHSTNYRGEQIIFDESYFINY